jgi:hypothetical protein
VSKGVRKAKDSRDIVVGAGALPNFDLACGAGLSADFAALGHWDYHAAARHVRRLPFGRDSLRANYGLVLTEGRGTGSTKYALLAALAGEHGRPMELRLSIYEMNADNTPGVGPVLRRCGLDLVPEAHCYLACRGVRVDLTRVATTDPIEGFLYEETIGPAGIDAYKVDVHRWVVRGWAVERGLDFGYVWRVREECTVALSELDLA